jgi:hypothetical protein
VFDTNNSSLVNSSFILVVSLIDIINLIKQDLNSFKNLSKQDFVNACKLLVGWGLEPPTLKIVSSQEFVKFKDSLVTMIHELNSNGYCSSRKRGRLSLEQFKIVYFEKMQALKQSL